MSLDNGAMASQQGGREGYDAANSVEATSSSLAFLTRIWYLRSKTSHHLQLLSI